MVKILSTVICANPECSNSFVKRNRQKYCSVKCSTYSRVEYMRKYWKKHRSLKHEGKPWDVIWYKQYRDKYIERIKAIPPNLWLEVKEVVPVYCEAIEQFFGLNGSPMTKLKEINEGNSVRNYRQIRILLCYFHIISFPLKDPGIRAGVRSLMDKIKQGRIANQIARNKQYMANRLGLEHFPENVRGLSILGCDSLLPREEFVLRARYGLDGTGVTKLYACVGKQIGVSKERIRQILCDGVRKLRFRNCNPRLIISIPYH